MNGFSKPVARLFLALPFIALSILVACRDEDGNSVTQSTPGTIDAAEKSVPGLGEAPPFSLVSMDGEEIALEDYRGKVVFINFWATWCAPCRVEIPDFISLQKEYGDRGLQIIGVALDEEGFEAVRPYAGEMGINYPIVLDDYTLGNRMGGVYAIPSTYMIDKNGIIRGRKIGYFPEEEMREKLQRLLEAD